MTFKFKRREVGFGNLEYGARYLVVEPFDVLKVGSIVRLRTAYMDVGEPPQVYEFTLDDLNIIKIRIVPDRDCDQLAKALSPVDHYEVRGSVFEYQSPNGKLIRKFDGEIHAVFFGFGRIYLTESKDGLPSNLHCMDYNLQDLWMHPGQGNDDPYDCIVARNGNLVMTSTMMVAEFEPYTGAWVWGSLNK